MKSSTLLAVAIGMVVPALSSAARADYWATIHDDGPLMAIQSGAVSDPFAGSADNTISTPALASIHQQLAADGVETDGYVTFVMMESAGSLSMLVLFDKETLLPDPAIELDVHMAMRAVALTNASFRMNDMGYDAYVADLGGAVKSVEATFGWEEPTRGDAFAWTGLQVGDELLFEFDNTIGTPFSMEGVQFVTRTAGTWSSLRTDSFGQDGRYSINLKIAADAVPAPGALAMLGLAGLVGHRRRRR